MRVLVACEESQAVTVAFRSLGHDAYSSDLLPCSGPFPQWHLQCDCLSLIHQLWDLVIAFPPCTHLCASGARWFPAKRSDGRQASAIDFFLAFTSLPRVAIENPVGIMSTVYRKPDQTIQPWQFGHGEVKRTCLWLKDLPLLRPSCVVDGRESRLWRLPPSADRSLVRSKTFPGIAFAMADQWGRLLV